MPDVFISYKKEERETAAHLATRLTEAGYDVWWDAALLAGDRFEDEIASVLGASRAVIVLWSKLSIGSDWVKAEAESARSQKKALPATIDDVPIDKLPLLFRGLHVVRLGGWTGDADHAGYRELMAAVGERLGAAAGPHLTSPEAEEKLAQNVSEAEVWSAIAASPQPSADEYRAYLKRFGETARFAELAHIRIARLDAAEKERKDDRTGVRRRWAPAIVLPLLALVLITGIGTWLWSRGSLGFVDDWFIPADARAAAQRCTAWSQGGDTEWLTSLPRLTGTIATDCKRATDAFPRDGDYKGMLAAVRLLQGQSSFADALNLAQQGTALDSPVAEKIMGVMYHFGMGVNGSFQLAGDHYKAAADKDDADAAARLCWLTIDMRGSPTETRWGDVFPYCSKAADADSPLGLMAMGYIFDNGEFGRTPDLTRAAEFYERAVALSSPWAKIHLAALLFEGLATGRNDTRAVQLLTEARAAGYPEAMRWLGIASELGTGVPPDTAQAGRYYEEAFQRGDFLVAALIGVGLGTGDPGYLARRDLARMSSYNPDDPLSLRVNGQVYASGFMVAANPQVAMEDFESCVDRSTFCNIALAYFLKYGPPQTADIGRARTLFETAAATGELHAQYELGVLYELGQGGLPIDTSEAARYFRLAAQQGSRIAQDRLNSLVGRMGNGSAPQQGG